MPKVSKEDLARINVEINHPCFQTGYKSLYSCSQCSIKQAAGSPRNGEVDVRKGNKGGTLIWLIGSPNWAECCVNLSEWSDISPGLDCEVQLCALAEEHPYLRG
ncbi:hypothetical protein RND81_07G064500 [Saponaria officinalis]|uniref:Uncharacterized protein n=1 Tax=Saponaria officinalis TaxID=3572 RepID=A0AAW1JMK3_SAPOF